MRIQLVENDAHFYEDVQKLHILPKNHDHITITVTNNFHMNEMSAWKLLVRSNPRKKPAISSSQGFLN